MEWIRQLLGRPRANASAPQVAHTDRIYAVGDIHGRADLLQDLLARIAQDAAARADERRSKYVFLGDYVDRGEQSKQVLEILRSLPAALDADVICLRGNHEAALLDFLEDPEAGARWLNFGGDQTLRSYGLDPAAPPLRLRDDFRKALGPHLAFLERTERFWISGDVAFVHAAINPRRAIDDQDDQDLYWGNRAFLKGRGRAGRLVVHGHYNDHSPIVTPHRICVDTGAYYSDNLTAVCLDQDVRFLGTDRP
jgi:serine/threonine protein phosphatase 1